MLNISDYVCEYARSDRSECRLCNTKIGMSALRIAIYVQCLSFDGKIPNWYHFNCFWKKENPIYTASIKGFDSLRWDDQQKIKKKMGLETTDESVEEKDDEAEIEEFSIEYSKSNSSKCKKCLTMIDKDVIRFGAKGPESIDVFYHLDCFAEAKSEIGFNHKIEEINGYNDLNEEDKKKASNLIKPPNQKRKIKDEPDENEIGLGVKKLKSEGSNLEKQLKAQSEKFWQLRDSLNKELSNDLLKELIQKNSQKINKGGRDDLLTFLTDIMMFGPLEQCPKCQNGQPIYGSTAYYCTGHITEWTKCRYRTQDPKRNNTFHFDAKLKKEFTCFQNFKFQPGKRLFPKTLDQIEKEKKRKFQRFEPRGYDEKYMEENKENFSMAKKTDYDNAKIKMKLKGGVVVDPDTNLQDEAHVLLEKNFVQNPYSVVLGLVDILSGTNSYYKMQVIEHDKKSTFYVFRSWGRVGTTIGSNKLECYSNKNEAIKKFSSLYLEKTGNSWASRKYAKKQPNKFYPLEMDFRNDDDDVKSRLSDQNYVSSSKLDLPIQNLIKLIFDIEKMKQQMKEFEIDLNKMPLGKISSNQIKQAFSILNELNEHLGLRSSNTHILDASNRFYTLIPHDFGMKKPILLNDPELIKNKTEMLNYLLDIEIAYNILKTYSNSSEDPIDMHYKKLNCQMEVLDKNSEEFSLILKYVQNTHASTHSSYKLIVEDVFIIVREGEESRYEKYKGLHNKKLLWHGSRLTNFAGILSQGLRIAPPEAPCTGYMFGKGVYFADIVSKSANYCYTNSSNPTGLMLLCEVALGDMYERTHSEYVTTLPKGKNSTKGCGRTAPNPNDKHVMSDGVEIPFGNAANSGKKASELLYNEYIVYDVNQIKMKYLLKVKFDHEIN